MEDEALIAMLLEDLVQELGFEPHVYGTSERALAALGDSEAFDLAILDVNLGISFSYPVADVLAARGIPFAFATGYGRAGVDARYRDVSVLSKPIDRESLQTMIAQLRRC